MAKRSQFADIGPKTRKLMEVRAGVRGIDRALERGSCKDAAALIRLTGNEIHKLGHVDANTQFWFDEYKRQFKTSCKTGLTRRRRH